MKPLNPKLLQHAGAARTYIIFTTLTGILITGLVVAQVLLIAFIVGGAVDGSATWDDLRPLIVALAAVLAGRVGAIMLQERFAHRASQSVITQLRGKVLNHAIAQGPRWLDSTRSAEVVTLTTRGLDALGPYFERYLPQLLLAVTLTPGVLIVLYVTDWTSGLILTVAIPLIPLFMWLVGVLTATYSTRRLQTMDRLGGQVMDLLGGLATLKALGREHGPGARVRALADAFNAATIQTLRVAFLSGAILEFVASISVALVAVVAGMRLVYGEIPLATGLAAIMLAPEILSPLRQVGSHFHASSDGIAAADAAFEILETPAPVRGTELAPDLRHHRIVLNGLSILAPDRNLLAPAHLEGEIPPGSVVALVGASGSGKSTAALVLANLLAAPRGMVHVTPEPQEPAAHQSIDLADIDPDSWHRQLTWVPARPTILPGTILENVTGEFGNAQRTAAVERAAQISGLAPVIAQAPDGWETRIGHGGVGLSVGQRQRLALARAFLQDTPLVLLDEPTAHLDAATEAEVTDAVRELKAAGRTVVVIAHRPGVLTAADRVLQVTAAPAGSKAGVP